MRTWIVMLLASLTASLCTVSPVGATPTPPVIVVNHSTKQCAEVIQGDDCHWCDLLEGWEIVGYSREASCPTGYENLGFKGMAWECRAYKNSFCCSNPAHHGDCDDLIINESEQLCAFVEEIRGCVLPDGWTSAADTTRWSGRCPFENKWLPDVKCVATPKAAEPTTAAPTAVSTPTKAVEPTTAAPTAVSTPTKGVEPTTAAPTAVSTPTYAATLAATQQTPPEDRFWPGIVWGCSVTLGGLFVAAVWLTRKRSRRR